MNTACGILTYFIRLLRLWWRLVAPFAWWIKPYFSLPVQCTQTKVSYFYVNWYFLRPRKQTSAQYWLPLSFWIQELSRDAMVITRSTTQRPGRCRNSLTRQDIFTRLKLPITVCLFKDIKKLIANFVIIAIHIKRHENLRRSFPLKESMRHNVLTTDTSLSTDSLVVLSYIFMYSCGTMWNLLLIVMNKKLHNRQNVQNILPCIIFQLWIFILCQWGIDVDVSVVAPHNWWRSSQRRSITFETVVKLEAGCWLKKLDAIFLAQLICIDA